MGYYVEHVDGDFFIEEKNIVDVVVAIHRLASADSSYMSGQGYDNNGNLTPCYSWVNSTYMNTTNIKDIFNYWRWNIHFDESGNIDGISFDAEKLGDDEILMEAIAPFVKQHSFIEMRGEDGAMWRWLFKNKQMKTIYPKIIWGE